MALIAVALSTGAICGQTQEETFTLDEDLLRSAEQLAKENLDDDTLRALQEVDREKVRQFLAELQRDFRGEYVLDLTGLKDSAKALLPLLERYEETLPYAVWLKPRLDYFETTEQLRLVVPPPKTEPGQPPRFMNPPAQKEREVWISKLAHRDVPEAAKPYVPRLKPVFAAEKVPPELVWLAEVESGFDPRARSPMGAAGLFQLMPSTAKRYGLGTSWLRDERYNPEPSGRAAAQHLRHLHDRFRDWRLALAAYNAGEGNVEQLLKSHKSHSYEEIATRLPAETQLYVPKVEATILRREGVKLSQL
jgi:membrane-bound lytic murein transglycosylase D